MNYLLYNELADSGEGKRNAEVAIAHLKEHGYEIGEQISLIGLDLKAFFKGKKDGDEVVIFGGDGTLNHFINDLGDLEPKCVLKLYPTGTGNDFQRDLPESDREEGTGLYPLNKYIAKLPIIECQGKTYRFLNGIGYGIDGECCVKAEELKKEGKKDINYGSVTIGLLLKGTYVPPKATIKIDDNEPIVVEKAYLASAMNGRYYGGGMMIAPEQDRLSGTLTLACIHGRGRIGTFLMLPKLFKGTHVKDKKACLICGGAKRIEVSFDRPTGLQIDGEVLTGVTSYVAYVKE